MFLGASLTFRNVISTAPRTSSSGVSIDIRTPFKMDRYLHLLLMASSVTLMITVKVVAWPYNATLTLTSHKMLFFYPKADLTSSLKIRVMTYFQCDFSAGLILPEESPVSCGARLAL